MPYVTGYLSIIEAGRPDQGLPGQPNYPSQGPGFPTNPIAPGGMPNYPSNELPGQPNYPSQGPGFPTNPIAPGGGGNYPSNELPPITGVWPPLSPSHPIVPVPPQIDNSLPPGGVFPPLPPSAEGKYLVVVVIPGVGYRYVVIDTNAEISLPIAPGGEYPSHQPVPGNPPRPDQGLPPTAQPKK
jgi:hypothetical protein